jgi:hypothetical protein
VRRAWDEMLYLLKRNSSLPSYGRGQNTRNVAALLQENIVRDKGAEAFQQLPLIFGRCKYRCL